MEIGLGSLIMSRLKVAALVMMSVGVLAAGASGVARQTTDPQEKAKPAETRPVAKDAAVVAEVEATALEQRLERAEAAKLDIEFLRLEVQDLKLRIGSQSNTCLQIKGNLRSMATSPSPDPSYFDGNQTPESREKAKRQFQDSYDFAQSQLASLRKEFLAKSRELRNAERRLKELEKPAEPKEIQAAQAAPAGSSPDLKGTGDAERLEGIEAVNLDIELLRMEVDALKQNVTGAMRARMRSQGMVESLMEPPAPDPGHERNGLPLTGQAREDAKKQWIETLDSADVSLRKARSKYLSKSLDLKRKEQQLRDLAKDLPWPRQTEASRLAADSKATVESRPAADAERRLLDVERKLDLILKALEKQGRQPGR
jgi:hypothetical protein